MSEKTQKQIEIAERLQTLLLEQFEELMLDGEMTPTDRATLTRLLLANGWTIDPSRLPQGLQDKITGRIRYDEDPEID